MSLTETQLEARKTYIGSSDAKTIYESDPIAWEELILQKQGGQPIEFDKAARMRIDAGSFMESFVIDKFSEAAKVKATAWGIEFDKGYLHSTTDAMTSTGHVIEAKTHWGFMDIEELADLYAPQCQHHMLVTDTKFCWLPVFFGVRARLEWRQIKRDDDWLESYQKQAELFYDWLINGNKPNNMEFMVPPIWSEMFTTNVKYMDLDDQTMTQLNLGAQSIIEGKKAQEEASNAKSVFKDLLPEKCKQMDYELTGNWEGHTIRVSRSKSNTLTCRHIAPKEAKDNE